MAFKEYENPNELKKLQSLTTDILGEFDRVCRKLDIPYFIYAGTAIGAVRHGGFIPWDDDIDVGMFRDDYDRFLREAPSVVGSDFEVVDYHDEPFFPACNANLVLRGTLCVPEEFDGCSFQYPIGIGIYAYDRISDDPKTRKRQLRGTWLWARLAFLRATPCPHLFIEGWKKSVVSLLCRVAHATMKVLHVSPRWIHRKWERCATLARSEGDGLFVDFTDQNPLAWTASKDEVFPLHDIVFDGITVRMANQYDAMLRRGYGDYMQLPPEDKRKNHYPSKLDFGRFA